jgi:8-oxo-dGTP diphosphatase
VTLYVVRHAHAGRRSDWNADDRTRPLSDRGELQAKGIATAIDRDRERSAPLRILTSPAKRCDQTVQPLAHQCGGEIVVDDRLFEGADRDEISSLLDDIARAVDDGADVVACSHGDVIPVLLGLLVDDGMQPARNLVWQKASMWTVRRTDGRWGTGEYLPPPDRA